MEGIKLKNGLVYYFGSPAGYVMDMTANMDRLFECDEILTWCKDRSYTACFREDIFESLVKNESLSVFSEMQNNLKSVRIWQLKADSDFSMRFISFRECETLFGEPFIENYDMVYDGMLATNNLDEIYELFSSDSKVNSLGRAISISDVVELYDSESSSYHYVDRLGFREITFTTHTQKNQNIGG